MSVSILKESKSVDWNYYDKFDGVNQKYLPRNGEGDTMATQLVTAVNKLVYRYYNDGDVYDNVHSGLVGWANDLSDYANWLWKHIPESKKILEKVFDMPGTDGYEEILKELADTLFDEKVINKYEENLTSGTVYDCDGPFEFEEDDYEEEDDYDYEEDEEEDDFEEESLDLKEERATRIRYKGYIIKGRKNEDGEEEFDVYKPSWDTDYAIWDGCSSVDEAKEWIDGDIEDSAEEESCDLDESISQDDLDEAKDYLHSNWGEDGDKVVEACSKVKPFNGNASEFLDHCTAHGGNWGGMLLSGVKKLYPEVYEAIPAKMGKSAWQCICYVLMLCGVDTSDGTQTEDLKKEGKEMVTKISENKKVVKESGELSVMRYSTQGGPNKPFPDGSAEGDLRGNNGVLTAEVSFAPGWSDEGDYIVEAHFNEDEDDDEVDTLSKVFSSGKEAINFAEVLLKEVTDSMYSTKKVARKYGMERSAD